MNSAEDLRDAAQEAHDILSRQYYKAREAFPGGKPAFDQQHAALWERLETDLRAIGALPPPEKTLDERLTDLDELLTYTRGFELGELKARVSALESQILRAP